MSVTDILLEVLRYSAPVLVVFATTYFVLKAYLDNDYKKRLLEFRESSQKTILPLRLQAYERMTLFLERISPNNLMHRVRKQNMTAREFHTALITSIRMEYEHNLSQQIYLSPQCWELILAVKEEMINLINRCAAQVPQNGTAADVSKVILETLIQIDQILPTQKALNALKAEARQLH